MYRCNRHKCINVQNKKNKKTKKRKNKINKGNDTIMDNPSHQYLNKVDQVIVSANPKYITWVTAICITAWAWLILQSAGVSDVGINTGPGMKPLIPMLDKIAQIANDTVVVKALLKLCVPQEVSAVNLFGVLLMWVAMSVAMMMPSAMPMFQTYADIANLAKQQKKQAQPLYLLASGYLVCWVVFSVVAATAQTIAIQYGWVTGPEPQYRIAPIILIGAGLYQFSPLKYACLKRCQNPFGTLFGQWKTTKSGVVSLGVKQGIYCIGCCWAIMGVMIVVGTMNLMWMAMLTLITIAEKNTASGKKISIITGTFFVIWGITAFIYT